jgi:hypothetical protein
LASLISSFFQPVAGLLYPRPFRHAAPGEARLRRQYVVLEHGGLRSTHCYVIIRN